jgi:hypothetical protein
LQQYGGAIIITVMEIAEMKNEIILYRPNELAEHIEVRFEENTVWLSQTQMAELFGRTKQNISLHINNCYKENELSKDSTVKEYLTVQKEGSRNVKRNVEYYNLDVIISVGYRVKSQQGISWGEYTEDSLMMDELIQNKRGHAVYLYSFVCQRSVTI